MHFSKRDLAGLVCRMVHAQDASVLHPVFSFEANRLYSPCIMLGLVTYAYAAGIYRSDQVALLARQEKELGKLCLGQFPGAEEVRCFREQNRVMIQDFLARVIEAVSHEVGWTKAPTGKPGPVCGFSQNWIYYEAIERVRSAEREDRHAPVR